MHVSAPRFVPLPASHAVTLAQSQKCIKCIKCIISIRGECLLRVYSLLISLYTVFLIVDALDALDALVTVKSPMVNVLAHKAIVDRGAAAAPARDAPLPLERACQFTPLHLVMAT